MVKLDDCMKLKGGLAISRGGSYTAYFVCTCRCGPGAQNNRLKVWPITKRTEHAKGLDQFA